VPNARRGQVAPYGAAAGRVGLLKGVEHMGDSAVLDQALGRCPAAPRLQAGEQYVLPLTLGMTPPHAWHVWVGALLALFEHARLQNVPL
jgi:hypothetical protein